jgi:hypothetical protein
MPRNTFAEVGHYSPKYPEFNISRWSLWSEMGGNLWSEINVSGVGNYAPKQVVYLTPK